MPAWSGEASRSGLQRAPSHCVLLVSHLGRGLIPSCGPSLMTTPNSHHLPKALLQIPSHCGVRAPTYGFGGTLLPLTFCLDLMSSGACSAPGVPCPVPQFLSCCLLPGLLSQRLRGLLRRNGSPTLAGILPKSCLLEPKPSTTLCSLQATSSRPRGHASSPKAVPLLGWCDDRLLLEGRTLPLLGPLPSSHGPA